MELVGLLLMSEREWLFHHCSFVIENKIIRILSGISFYFVIRSIETKERFKGKVIVEFFFSGSLGEYSNLLWL